MPVPDEVLDAIDDSYGRLGADVRLMEKAVMRITMLHALDPECVEEVFKIRGGVKKTGRKSGARARQPLPPDEMEEVEMTRDGIRSELGIGICA